MQRRIDSQVEDAIVPGRRWALAASQQEQVPALASVGQKVQNEHAVKGALTGRRYLACSL